MKRDVPLKRHGNFQNFLIINIYWSKRVNSHLRLVIHNDCEENFHNNIHSNSNTNMETGKGCADFVCSLKPKLTLFAAWLKVYIKLWGGGLKHGFREQKTKNKCKILKEQLFHNILHTWGMLSSPAAKRVKSDIRIKTYNIFTLVNLESLNTLVLILANICPYKKCDHRFNIYNPYKISRTIIFI